MSCISCKMTNLVEISSMVASSTNFFEIKDDIIDKMLQVVHPTKACVNLFYDNDYNHAYLVCSNTLSYIKDTFKPIDKIGTKLDFYEEYPDYIHEAVEDKKVVYVDNLFEDPRAEREVQLAKLEGYRGRIVFPIVLNKDVVGFMTCFLTEEDELKKEDIDFISSVASLIALSLEITEKNKEKGLIINKLRKSLELISDATRKLYLTKNIKEFLIDLLDLAQKITNSESADIIFDEKNNMFNSYSNLYDKKVDIQPILDNLLSTEVDGDYINDKENVNSTNQYINSYIYYKLTNEDKDIGVIICTNGKKYTDDDLSILSILSRQVTVAMQLFEYSEQNVKHKLIAKELNILNKQQKLIMNESKMECNKEKELEFYHKPATVVGGDFYYAYRIDEDRVAYIVADVMGHGIVANYMVAMIKGAFKTLCHQYKTPGEIATYLNKILYDEFDKMGVFATCLISVFSVKENILSVSNSGHYSPIFIDINGEIVDNMNCKKGIPIGVLPEGVYHSNTFSIKDFSMIFMFTDGVLEIKNSNKEEYGLERLRLFVKNNYRYNKDTIIENLKRDIEEFSGSDNYDDDILIVMLKNK